MGSIPLARRRRRGRQPMKLLSYMGANIYPSVAWSRLHLADQQVTTMCCLFVRSVVAPKVRVGQSEGLKGGLRPRICEFVRKSAKTHGPYIAKVRVAGSSPVFRSESTRGAVSVAFRDGPERIADPRWLAVDIVPEHANRCTSQSEACQSE